MSIGLVRMITKTIFWNTWTTRLYRLRDCADHALAVLQFAETFQYREIWTDAFVHCVGMNDQLDTSAEFEVR